jgi:hypothetical protein
LFCFQIDAVFEKYDKNRDGKLDFDEFRELMEANAKSKKDQQEALLQQQHQQQQHQLQQPQQKEPEH